MFLKFVIFVIVVCSFNNKCALGLSTSEKTTKCEPIQIAACQGLGYNVTYMPNFFRHPNQNEARESVRT